MSIAIVTGGSRGLGRSMVEQLGAKGHDAILTYNSKKAEADEVVAGLVKQGRKALALQLDVSKQGTFAAFAQAVKKGLKEVWGRQDFDIVVNNAGIGIYKPFMQTTPEDFDLLMNIHLKGPYFLIQQLLPLMRDGGRIINVSSGLTRFSYAGYSAYATMKGGVEVLSRYLAVELGPRGIGVVTVAPGAIETDFGGGVVRDNKEVNKTIAGQTPLGRVGLPEDIGKVVAALASDDLYWVNGQRIEASGGINS
jgi:NAD(P)-dependent dehydrogenase (short-subunit alcohol dehydrogenase family)